MTLVQDDIFEVDGDHAVPADLLELYEVLEFNGITKRLGSGELARPTRAEPSPYPSLKFVSRGEWGAAEPAQHRTALHPSFGSTAHYEGPHFGAFPHESCATKVRGIQRFHMQTRGWNDIAYSALVCPHGYVYEGRWIGARTAANGTNPGNAESYAVCVLIGVDDPFTAGARAALIETFWVLERVGGAGTGIRGHRDWKSTACPGALIYNALDGIRAELDSRRKPAPPPATPIPAPIDYPDSEEDDDMLRSRLITMKLGTKVGADAGKGWARWDPKFGRPPIIVGFAINGRDPEHEGYGDNATPDIGVSVRDNTVVVTAEEGQPGGLVGVHVTVR